MGSPLYKGREWRRTICAVGAGNRGVALGKDVTTRILVCFSSVGVAGAVGCSMKAATVDFDSVIGTRFFLTNLCAQIIYIKT